MCNVCNVCNVLTCMSKHYCTVCNASRCFTAVFRRVNPTAFAMGLSLFIRSTGRGIFRRWLLSCILMSRVRLCFGRVVRFLERAEEGCEGLKHGYYDLPCVYFLIFLCHDIKNKIDRLFFLRTTAFGLFSKFYKISRCRIKE